MLSHHALLLLGASLVAQRVKNLPAMQESWVQFLGWEDPLEQEMATHSSVRDWRILWKEEPGRLQSMGSQRARHNLVTKPPPLPLTLSKVGLEIPWMLTSFFFLVRLSQDHLIFIMCTVLSQMSRVCSDVHRKCYRLFLFWNKRFLYIVNPNVCFPQFCSQ